MAVLKLHDGSMIADPSANQIEEILGRLSPPRSFAILSRSDDVYIQTKPTGHGRFIVEYQSGSVDEHYEACWGASLAEVIALFQGYQRGDEPSTFKLDWRKLDLGASSPQLYPAPDRSGFVPNSAKTAENDQLDIGWSTGILSDGRPFRAECWAQDQVTMLTLFFSTKGLEQATSEELLALLEVEGVIAFTGAERYGTAAKLVDAGNNEMWSMNIVVGADDQAFVRDNIELHPYQEQRE